MDMKEITSKVWREKLETKNIKCSKSKRGWIRMKSSGKTKIMLEHKNEEEEKKRERQTAEKQTAGFASTKTRKSS